MGKNYPDTNLWIFGNSDLPYIRIIRGLVEDSHSRLRESPGAVERCCSSSYEDDDGRMQGGKSTATCGLEFQMVNEHCGNYNVWRLFIREFI
jgi:hypothetical protein